VAVDVWEHRTFLFFDIWTRGRDRDHSKLGLLFTYEVQDLLGSPAEEPVLSQWKGRQRFLNRDYANTVGKSLQ